MTDPKPDAWTCPICWTRYVVPELARICREKHLR